MSLIGVRDLVGLVIDRALATLKGKYGRKQGKQVLAYVRSKQKIEYVKADGSIAVPANKVHLFIVLLLKGCAHAAQHG